MSTFGDRIPAGKIVSLDSLLNAEDDRGEIPEDYVDEEWLEEDRRRWEQDLEKYAKEYAYYKMTGDFLR